MGYSFLITTAIMLETYKNIRHRAKEFTKTQKMDITTKDNGRKIYNMGMAFKSMQIKMSTMADLCVVANSEKDNTNLQMAEFIKDHSTTDIAMGMVN